MSLQVCGGSPGPSAAGAWEAGRQGRVLQEKNRPVPSSTCQLRTEQRGGHVYSRPLGLRHRFYQSVPSPSVEGRVLHMPSECPSGHLSSLDYLWR